VGGADRRCAGRRSGGLRHDPADSLSPSSPSLNPTAVSPSPSPVRLSGRGSSAADRVWSGYCAVGRHFTSVTATWTQPDLTAKGKGQRAVDIWVGLDGYSGPTVEQVGSEGDSQGGTDPWVWSAAWWEMYPAPFQPRR